MICICRYEGHDYPSKPVTPLIYTSVALTVNRALPVDKSWGTSPRSAVFLASSQQPAAFISVSSNVNWKHSIPCHFKTIYSKSTSPLQLPSHNWNELKKKNIIVWSLIHRYNNHVKENSTHFGWNIYIYTHAQQYFKSTKGSRIKV